MLRNTKQGQIKKNKNVCKINWLLTKMFSNFVIRQILN